MLNLREYNEFYRQCRVQFKTTGSLMPSGRILGRALTRPMRRAKGPRRVCEVGPGTGAVTRTILKELRPGDTLTLVEINPDFSTYLRHRFETDREWKKKADQVTLLNLPVQEVRVEQPFDFLISGIPLNNFEPSLVEDVFQAYENLLRPGGILSYFEYMWVREVRHWFTPPHGEAGKRFPGRLLNEKIRRYQVCEEEVFVNFPPAMARHMCFQRNTAAPAPEANGANGSPKNGQAPAALGQAAS